MKTLTLTGMLLALTMTGCIGDKTLQFGKLEVRYTDNVTEADASRLGEYLSKKMKMKNKAATVKLDKKGDTYQVLMVVIDDYKKNMAQIKMMAVMVAANVFPNATVELHLTDKNLNLREVVKPDAALVNIIKKVNAAKLASKTSKSR